MKKILITIQAVMIVLLLATGYSARAESYPDETAGRIEQPGEALFTPDELDELLAPIALYPDPLIAQMLPAATFVDQIDEAARYIRQYGKDAQIDDQPWDVSVKAVTHYPEVLFMMDSKYDWTVSLGQAFINQQQDVMDAIQRLRAEAEAAGNLVSSSQQRVINEDGFISIVPAEPDLLYVPRYDPLVVYVERPDPFHGFITFGIGFGIGAWLNRDCDWRRHRVYYHGWSGGGWIRKTRPHIRIKNNIYINNRFSTVRTNHTVKRYDTRAFRENIRSDARSGKERRSQTAIRNMVIRPGNKGIANSAPSRPVTKSPRPGPKTPGLPIPVPSVVKPGPSSAGPVIRRQGSNNRDVYRGREAWGAQPAPNSGHGSYGGGKSTPADREERDQKRPR